MSTRKHTEGNDNVLFIEDDNENVLTVVKHEQGIHSIGLSGSVVIVSVEDFYSLKDFLNSEYIDPNQTNLF